MTDITIHHESNLPTRQGSPLPQVIDAAGEQARRSFIEFFIADIENDNTRQAYARAVRTFFQWCGAKQLELSEIAPAHVAVYFKQHGGSKPTKKQHLAAIRRLFDYLVTKQVVPFNPAAAVRGPRYSVRKGKTPVISAEDMRKLLDSIDTGEMIGVRDRALIATMFYSFGRVGAVTQMNVEDYYHNGKRSYIRLDEKGGKVLEIPVHHSAQHFLDEYVARAGIASEEASPLFRTIGRTRSLTDRRLDRVNAWRVMKKRAKEAGVYKKISPHSLRATGITIYLGNGGSLEHAQTIAGHADPRTTKLYDRTSDQVSLDEIEKIVI